jgi:hydroxyacylglutathione hydrolase
MTAYKLKTMVLGMIQTNCYIISNDSLKEAIVIDPAERAEIIEQYLKENDLTCKGILITHGHFDHILAANDLSAYTGGKIYMMKKEALLLNNGELDAPIFLRKKSCNIVPDVLTEDQQVLDLAGFNIEVIHTPGHTAGGASYYFTDINVLFSGDTLFYESVGRTDFPTGDLQKIIESIRSRLMALDDKVKVYPGHGDTTTIGHERQYNIYINDGLK